MGNLLTDTYGCVVDIYDRIKKWHELGDDNDAKLRLFYLECKRNLAVLDCIGTRKVANVSIDEAEPQYIALLLEIDILEMIFLANSENIAFFKVLSQKAEVKTKGKDCLPDEIMTDKANQNKSIIQWAMFIYVRVSVLKKLAEMKKGQKSLKKIKYRQRLHNIKVAYLGIVNQLKKQETLKIF